MLAEVATTLGVVKNEASKVRNALKTRIFNIRTYQSILDVATGNVTLSQSRPKRTFYGSRRWLPPPCENRNIEITTLYNLLFHFCTLAILLNRHDSTPGAVKLTESWWETVARCVAEVPTTTLSLPRIYHIYGP